MLLDSGTAAPPAPATARRPREVTDELVDLTQHEILALKTTHNLADAHTHQEQSESQHGIVTRLPDLWRESERNTQEHYELRFLDAFFRLHKQPTAARLGKSLLSYSASVATMVAAMHLRQRNMSVALIEPCFDNLVDLLRHMEVELAPLAEDVLADPRTIFAELDRAVTADALYLVDPNNPTGFSVHKDGSRGFEEVVRFCVERDKLLVLDFCFASFLLADERHDRFDVYRLLEESGVSYLVIEDTGKTWPVQDAKCAILTASEDIRRTIYNIHTAVLLNVSPFVLNLLGDYVEDSITDRMASIRDVILRNRRTAREALAGTVLRHVEPVVATSVAWFEIAPGGPTATELQAALRDHDVYVLPGTYFYWSDPPRGERYVRVALARRPEMFEAAMRAMREVLDRHGW